MVNDSVDDVCSGIIFFGDVIALGFSDGEVLK